MPKVYWFDGLNERKVVFANVDAAISFFVFAIASGKKASVFFGR